MLFDVGAWTSYDGKEATVIAAAQHHEEHRMPSDDDSRGPGRPRLIQDEDTKRLTTRMPESLHAESKAVAEEVGLDLAAIVRGLLAGYNAWPNEARKALNSEDKIREFVASLQ